MFVTCALTLVPIPTFELPALFHRLSQCVHDDGRYRRLTFIAAYAAEILLLVLTWLVFHFSHEQSTASFVVDKAVICGSGILLLMAFGVPDRCCMCQCRKMSEMQSISNAKATAALLVQAEREASERERQARRDRLELGSSEVSEDDWGHQ